MKISSLLRILLFFALSSFFAPLFAEGTALGLSAGGEACTKDFSSCNARWTLGASFKRETVPLYFYARGVFDRSDLESAFFSMDYWICSPKIGESFIHWFYGPGFSAGEVCGNFCARLRAVSGLYFFATHNLEFYSQLSAEAGGVFKSALEPSFSLLCECGSRLYF